MKYLIFLIPSLLIADCTVEDAISELRPGAAWTIQDSDISKIQWLDQTQSRPTAKELSDTLRDCSSRKITRNNLKTASRAILKNPASSDAAKINALILIMDLDR